jgi:beta-1,4-mannosyl-glycoprotein beta-1,4-N-acetylglucosaminyltransferase
MKVADCFIFFNEYDTFDIRYKALSPVIDKFVVVEGNKIFSGINKMWNLPAIQNRYDPDKIIYVQHEFKTIELPFNHRDTEREAGIAQAWKMEYQQRDAISKGVELLEEDTICIIGDIDELYSRDVVRSLLRKKELNLPLAIQQYFFYYSFNNLRNEEWRGSIITSRSLLLSYGAQWHRDKRNELDHIKYGGWHFSYLADTEKIKEKIKSFAHQELNTDAFTNNEHIEECLATGRDLFNRNIQSKKVPLSFHPKYLQKILLQYPQYITGR